MKLSTTFYFIFLVSLGYVATDIYLPSLPALGDYFQTSDYFVQMTLFSYLLSFSFTPLICGPLSDHYGRKKIILFGIIISLFSTLTCQFANSIEMLIASRLFQGFGTGAVMIGARASVADTFRGKALTRQMSLMSSLMPLILATAPTLGGLLQERYGWQSVFVFLSVYMAALAFLVFFKKESAHQTPDQKLHEAFFIYKSHFTNKLFLSYGFNYILPSLGLWAYLTISPFLFQETLGLSPLEYGSLSIYIGATILFSGFINLKLLHHFHVKQIILIGVSLMLLSGSLLLLFHFLNFLTTWSVLIPMLLYFTCVPFCSANASSHSLTFVKGNFGAASALLNSLQLLFGAGVSYLFSSISDHTTFPLAICFLFLGAIALINLKFAGDLESTQEAIP